VPAHHLSRLEERRGQVGSARVSVQQMVTLVPHGRNGKEILEQADRRFGWMGNVGRATGSGAELVANFEAHRQLGVERFYVWFTDFAPPDTLRSFGSEVIDRVG
jgi:hypothetical protein